MRLIIEDGLRKGEEGSVTQERTRAFFELLMNLQERKQSNYSDAWREQGWVGNVGRVLSKASRLRNMVWTDIPRNDAEETVQDTLMDLALLAAFTYFNMEDGNRWGTRESWTKSLKSESSSKPVGRRAKSAEN